MNIKSQIIELLLLRDGWFDGHGIAPKKEFLIWLERSFYNFYHNKLPIPKLYPTPEGNIQAELSIYNKEISLIILEKKQCKLQCLDMKTKECIDLDLNLSNLRDWGKLNKILLKNINNKLDK